MRARIRTTRVLFDLLCPITFLRCSEVRLGYRDRAPSSQVSAAVVAGLRREGEIACANTAPVSLCHCVLRLLTLQRMSTGQAVVLAC